MTVEFDVDREEFVQERVSAGSLPRNDARKQLVLEAIVDEFDVGETYAKETVDETIRPYFDDHVLVRRELVNFGYLTHDPCEGTYTVAKQRLTEADYRSISRLERHARDISLLD